MLSVRALILAVLPISQKLVSNDILSDLQRQNPVTSLPEDDNCTVKTFIPNGLLSGSQCLAILHPSIRTCSYIREQLQIGTFLPLLKPLVFPLAFFPLLSLHMEKHAARLDPSRDFPSEQRHSMEK